MRSEIQAPNPSQRVFRGPSADSDIYAESLVTLTRRIASPQGSEGRWSRDPPLYIPATKNSEYISCEFHLMSDSHEFQNRQYPPKYSLHIEFLILKIYSSRFWPGAGVDEEVELQGVGRLD